MWATPIIYPATLVHQFTGDGFLQWPLLPQPAGRRRLAFQRALYGVVYYPGTETPPAASDSIGFYLATLGIGFVVSAGVLALGPWQFKRLSADFAEDL